MRWRAQEVAFSSTMAAVAVLGRDNPLLRLPHVLWAFAALLAFNLAYHIALRRKGDYWVVPMVSMAANMALITAVLAFSGGLESYFWPMYLLPVFTSCLYLEPRHVGLAVAASVGFLGCFYLDVALDEAPAWRLWELAVKGGVLALSGWVTSQLSLRERSARGGLEAARGQLDALARAHPGRVKASGRFSDGVLFDVYSQLVVLSGSVEILRDRLPDGEKEDLARIESSARSLKELVGEILRLSDQDGDEAEVDLAQLLKRTLTLVAYKARYRELDVRVDGLERVPLRQDRVRLQQSLLELLQWLMLNAREGSRVEFSLSRDGLEASADCPGEFEPGIKALFAARKWSLTSRRRDGRLILSAAFGKIGA